MKQILDESEIIGKAIINIIEGDEFVLVFSDKTFATFSTGYDSQYISIDNQPRDMTENNHNRSFLEEVGVITKERANEIWTDYQARLRDALVETELRKLAELKAKYPEQ